MMTREWVCLALRRLSSFVPSLCQAFLFSLLGSLGLPVGMISVISVQYLFAHAVDSAGDSGRFLMWLHSGVAQGCPMSGWLFVLAVDCLLGAIEAQLGPRDLLRGCADDVGLALERLGTLQRLASPPRTLARPWA